MYDFVSEITIDGEVYTLERDDAHPEKNYLRKNGKRKLFKDLSVWHRKDHLAIKKHF